MPGLSETIRVRSLVGRYLEHSRIYYFGEGANGASSPSGAREPAVVAAFSGGPASDRSGATSVPRSQDRPSGPSAPETNGGRRDFVRDRAGRFVGHPEVADLNIASGKVAEPDMAGHRGARNPSMLPEGGRYLMGSADMMERNLDRRVETLVDVSSPEIQERLREILEVELADDELAWELSPDETWHKVADIKHFNAQRHFQELAITRGQTVG